MIRVLVLCWSLVFGAVVASAQVPNPALLVLDKAGAQMVIVDVTSGKVVARVPTGEGPHEVVTDGKLAIVCNYGARTPGSTLSIIDLASPKEVRRVQLPGLLRPHGIVLHGGKAYFTAEWSRAVARYDIASDRIDWVMGTGQEISHMLAVNRDATAIYTADILSDSVTAIEAAPGPRGWQVTKIAVGRGPEGVDLSPDGKELWTAHSRDGGVSVIDTAARAVIATIPQLTKRSNRLKFTPDGRRVLISDPEANEVVVLDRASRKLVQRVKVDGLPLGILITPDGRVAYIATAKGGGVAILDLSTLQVSGRLATGGEPDGMAWVGSAVGAEAGK